VEPSGPFFRTTLDFGHYPLRGGRPRVSENVISVIPPEGPKPGNFRPNFYTTNHVGMGRYAETSFLGFSANSLAEACREMPTDCGRVGYPGSARKTEDVLDMSA
jgi:hypothetical protein